VCVAVASALHTEEEYQSFFTNFVVKYKKSYDVTEFFQRFHIFKNNIDLIDIHNEQADQGKWTFTLGVNHLADLTNEEYRVMLGFRSSKTDSGAGVHSHAKKGVPVAADWRKQGAVTPVQDQGQCGSCWAFSATGSMEGEHQIKTGKLISLSEQELVDCSRGYGNDGCNGGLMDNAFKYVIAHGITSEAEYPYKARDGTCEKKSPVVHITGYHDVPSGVESQLMPAVNIGPVSVAIEADQSCFQFYSGGILDNSGCGDQLDHGVLLIGYGTEGGHNYWIVKNSWGASWGEKGYIRMIRDHNECGIDLAASYPTGQ